ncbi:MAG: histidine kinase [Saprospiraceae bacterium]|jgi:two-component system LytT family sensor kinase|nr:histidine kinase [Saprospiraceae bacterium]
MKISLSDIQKKIFFHISLWGLWLYLTLSNVNDADFNNRFVLIASLIIFTHLPLFVFNTEWLIPNVLHKKGVNYYFWSLIAAIVLISFVHSFIFHTVNDMLGVEMKRGYKSYKGIIAIILVAAISTGYGLLNDFAQQSRIKEEKEKEKLQSELSFLRSQISPHFIFNVLNSIIFLIRSNTQLAEAVTLKLSELMRYMLYETGNERITLEKELSYLNNYIDLQKIRFDEDVLIEYKVEGDPKNLIIEPMLLIPFVENAFKHGVGLIQDPSISVFVKIKDADLEFSVRNKITPETASEKDTSTGIGLKNVERRLTLIYPQTHQLTTSSHGGDFDVLLKLSLK